MELVPSEVVVVATRNKITTLLLGASSLLSTKVYAFKLESTKLVFNFFQQDSKNGKQVYDDSGKEDVTVLEPMLFISTQIDEDTNLSAHFIFDTWTAASDTAIDGNSGASGGGIGNQSRVAGNISYTKGDELNGWSGSLGISSEYDYRSLNFGGQYLKSFAEDNFTIALTPQLYLDQAADYDLINEKTTDFKGRTIVSADLSASQLLTRSDIIEFGYTHIEMNGMLNSIASTVKVLDETTDPFKRQGEKLPENRSRSALHTKWVHAFSDETAFHLSYRYYQDNWEIKAQTTEIGMRFTTNDGNGFVMPTLRYHDQSQTKYYQDQFQSQQQFMTSDSDLSDFNLVRVGVQYSYEGDYKKRFGYDTSLVWGAGLFHGRRSNDLNYNILQLSIGMSF